MRTTIVLPSIDPGMTAGFVASVHPSLHSHIVVIDNGHEALSALPAPVRIRRFAHNLGVAASWNVGAREARQDDSTHVMMVSAQVRFGAGGLDIDGLSSVAEPWGCLPAPRFWHTATPSLAWWDRVGPADENFYPAYYEDCDLIRRSYLAGCPLPCIGEIDARGLRDGHGVDRLRHDFGGHPTINYEALEAYWWRKWGCHQNSAADLTVGFPTPYNRPDRDWTWWEPVPDIAALHVRYGIVGR